MSSGNDYSPRRYDDLVKTRLLAALARLGLFKKEPNSLFRFAREFDRLMEKNNG